jgi:hypothetical protein
MPEHIFHVERLSMVTIRDHQPDVLKEHTIEAWVPVATLTVETSIWRVFEDWFRDLPEAEQRGGRYRVIQPSATEHGFGTLSAHVVKPSWSVESEWEPAPVPDEEADVARVA